MNALQIGSLLFAIGGLFDALIGALTPFVTRMRPLPADSFLQNAAADLILYGRSPQALLSDDAPLAMLYRTTFDLIGALLLIFGLLQAGVAWFALRHGQAWALWLLVVVDILFIAGWALVYWQYFSRGIGLATIGIPPNLLVPAVLLIPATVLGVIGLQQQSN